MKYIFFQHQFLDNLLDKAGFYKSPAQKDEAIHFASLSRFQELYGDDADYRPGEPLPRRAWQLTQNVTDKLQPFIREYYAARTPSQIPANLLPGSRDDAPTVSVQALVDRNKFVLPLGWVHPTAMRFVVRPAEDVRGDVREDANDYLFPGADVKVMDDDKVGRRRRSQKVMPTQAYPVAEVAADGYRLWPSPEFLFYAKFLGLPARPVFGERVDRITQLTVYDDTRSVDTGWPEIDHNDVMMKAAEILGVPMQDAQLLNFTRYKAERGA